MAQTQPARGMRDFLPSDVRRRNYVIGIIREVYERYGFAPLETPAVENLETLTGKYGEEGNQLIFKILRRGEHEKTGQADLALRYDLTVPLARVVAEYRDKLPKFFKRYQIQPVWRADRPARGRYREFYQCDVDMCGSRSPMVEAELCAAVCDVLQALGFRDFTLRLNHRQLLAQLVQSAGIPDEKTTDALVALDKLDKIGRAGVQRELVQRGIVADAAENFIALFDGFERLAEDSQPDAVQGFAAFNQALLGHLEETSGPDDAAAQQTLAELRQIVAFVTATSAARHVKLDPSLARGLSYYTGAIMEIAVPDLAGSLGGGGRYDGLVGMFGKEQIPACGFSLGLERILVVMGERGMFPPTLDTVSADVLITLWNADYALTALELAAELRAAGVRVEVYPQPDKLAKQFKYAAALGVRYVATVGESEHAAGLVALKNMQTGAQKSIARAVIAAAIEL